MSEDRIVQRWRKPVTALAVEDTPDVMSFDAGRPTQDYKARFAPEQIERFRTGYACLNCWEPHETPFPEACSLCGYPMHAQQSEDFTQKFEGVERNPRAALIEKELDRVDDLHERRFHTTKSGIIVPTSL